MPSGRETSSQLRVVSLPYLSYLPQFVAETVGMFESKGLDVVVSLERRPFPRMRMLADVSEGRADLVLGNVWSAFDPGRFSDPLVPIACCVQQLRYILARRDDAQNTNDAFVWQELHGKSVIVPSDVPGPWLGFRHALRITNVSLDQVNLVIGFTPDDALTAFSSGWCDLIATDPERASRFPVVEVAALAEVLGPGPWSVYCTPRSVLEERRDALMSFRSALTDAEQWIADHTGTEIAAPIRNFFPEFEVDELAGFIDRYKRFELWPRDSTVNPKHVEEWQQVLFAGGVIRELTPVEEILRFA